MTFGLLRKIVTAPLLVGALGLALVAFVHPSSKGFSNERGEYHNLVREFSRLVDEHGDKNGVFDGIPEAIQACNAMGIPYEAYVEGVGFVSGDGAREYPIKSFQFITPTVEQLRHGINYYNNLQVQGSSQ